MLFIIVMSLLHYIFIVFFAAGTASSYVNQFNLFAICNLLLKVKLIAKNLNFSKHEYVSYFRCYRHSLLVLNTMSYFMYILVCE